MAPQLTIVAGPARSGKTARLLARFRHSLVSQPLGRRLWIAPTTRAAQAVRDSLLGPDVAACFGGRVLTFEQVAEAVLRSATVEVRPISRSARRQTLSHLLQEAHRRGELRYFGPLAENSGIVDQLSDFIAEMKRLEIWPEEFAEACSQRGMTAKDHDLSRIYAAYQQVLNQHRLYDQQGRFWAARSRLQDGQQQPFASLDLMIVDGFTDFTKPQHEILQVLVGRSAETLISLPLDESGGRDDVFDKPRRTLAQFEQCYAQLEIERLGGSAKSDADRSGLARLERVLFRNGKEGAADPAAGSTADADVELIAASRELGEIEEIARRIKQLIVEHDVPTSDIAVVFRSLGEVAPLVRETFEEFGVPVAIEVRPQLGESRTARALLALVQLAVEDWPFRQLINVVNFDIWRAAGRDVFRTQAVADAERIVRHLQIPSGRERLLQQVHRWAEPSDPIAADSGAADSGSVDEENWADVRRRLAENAAPLLDCLATALDVLPEEGTYREWADALRTLAAASGMIVSNEASPSGAPRGAIAADQATKAQTGSIHQRASSEWAATSGDEADRAALQRLLAAVELGGEAVAWCGETDKRITRWQLPALLADIMANESAMAEGDEVGRVRVLSAPGARGLRFDYLFLTGLSERSFPAPVGEGTVYGDAETSELISRGLPLADRRQRLNDEMLLFYETITRADRRLVLSYPAYNEKAEPLAPSPYVAEIVRLLDDALLRQTTITDFSPVPQTAQPMSPTEQRVLAVDRALAGDRRELAALATNERTTALWQAVSAGLGSVFERGKPHGFGQFEGMLGSPQARKATASRFGPNLLWSPSRLEEYASCPYRFFTERVLGLRPLDNLELQVDYRARGRMLHAALAEVHREINERSDADSLSQLFQEEDFLQKLDCALTAMVEVGPQSGTVGGAMVELDRREILRLGRQYVDQYQQYQGQWTDLSEPFHPAHFEVRFGPPGRHESSESATEASDRTPDQRTDLSTDEPFLLEVGGETILLTGRIDRIDRGVVGGQPAFNVIDYKLGKSATLKAEAIEGGLALQLPLYAMAAEQLFFADEGAVPWQIGYWLMRGQGFGPQTLAVYDVAEGRIGPTSQWEELRPKILSRVKTLVKRIRDGGFPVVSADENCTGTCPFHTVCRVTQVRALGKVVPPGEAGPT